MIPKPAGITLMQAEGDEDRLFFILEHPDGILYSTQAGGYSCAPTEARGYLIPLHEYGFNEGRGKALYEFFQAEPFCGHGSHGCFKRPEAVAVVPKLAALVAQIEYSLDYYYYPGRGDEKLHLALNREAVLAPESKAMESWLPVFAAPYGKGWLTWGNSD